MSLEKHKDSRAFLISPNVSNSKPAIGNQFMDTDNIGRLPAVTTKNNCSLAGRELSRRDFCSGTVAAAATLTIVPQRVLTGDDRTPPSERINVAVIGTGCHGTRHVKSLLANQPDIQLVAVCDVNAQSSDYHDFDYKDGIAGLDPARQIVESHYADQKRSGKYKGCAAYRDFREMLAKEQDIDAVIVATPDHAHAVVAMQAIKRGKHVYCEKPLAHSVHEARQLAEAARTTNVATQMGNQLHSLETVRRQVELIRSGAVGTVRQVHAWCVNTGWHGPWSAVLQRRWAAVGAAWAAGPDRPQDTPPVPKELDWDLWLGPAPERPYHPAYLPFKWRGWWDFGSGTLGDMGCHIIDPVLWALDLEAPVTIEASSTRITAETAPVSAIVHYTFSARGDRPAVALTWYEGGMKPARPRELADGQDLPASGVLYVGDEGKLLVPYFGTPTLLPDSRNKDFKRPLPFLPRVPLQVQGTDPLSLAHHHREWIDACKGGPAALSHFGYAGPLTEIALLGTIAIRTGKKLNWDGPNMQVTNVPVANEYVRTQYRHGWNL